MNTNVYILYFILTPVIILTGIYGYKMLRIFYYLSKYLKTISLLIDHTNGKIPIPLLIEFKEYYKKYPSNRIKHYCYQKALERYFTVEFPRKYKTGYTPTDALVTIMSCIALDNINNCWELFNELIECTSMTLEDVHFIIDQERCSEFIYIEQELEKI